MERQKKLVKNYIYNLSYQILALLAPLITTPYISRVLGPTGIGDYAYTNGIVSYFGFVAVLGTVPYGQREIAFHQGDKKERSRIFYEVLLFRCILIACVFVVYCMFLSVVGRNKVLYLIQICTVASWLADISWFFQGMEEFKATVIRNSLVKIFSVILILTLVRTENDVWLYTLILCGGAFAGNLTLWPFLKKHIQRVPLRELRPFRHARGAVEMFIPVISTQIYMILDETMLGTLLNNTQVGYYTQAKKILHLEMAVVGSLMTVLLPRLSVILSEKDLKLADEYYQRTVRFGFLMNLPMMMGTIIIAPRFSTLFLGEGYEPCISLMRIFSLILITEGISQIAGTILIAMKRQRLYSVSIVAGSVINFTANCLLIPRLGAAGAALASVISQICMESMQFYFIRPEFKSAIIGKAFISYIPAAVGMALVMIFAERFLGYDLFSLIVLFVLAVCSYFLYLFLRHDALLLEFIKDKKRRQDD